MHSIKTKHDNFYDSKGHAIVILQQNIFMFLQTNFQYTVKSKFYMALYSLF